MIRATTHRAKVYVVDANRADYANLADTSFRHTTQIVFFNSGREALRANPTNGPSLWVVNMDLPDMSGTDLHAMLRSRGNRTPLALVSDEYGVEDEIAARTCGADMYFAKSMIHEALLAVTQSSYSSCEAE